MDEVSVIDELHRPLTCPCVPSEKLIDLSQFSYFFVVSLFTAISCFQPCITWIVYDCVGRLYKGLFSIQKELIQLRCQSISWKDSGDQSW